MQRRFVVMAMLAAASAVTAGQSAPTTPERVVLDLVAVNREGLAVTDLRQDELQVRDNGQAVEIQKFTPVLADGASAGRSVIVVLDDAGVPASGTEALRTIAQNLLARMGPADDIGILRLGDAPAQMARRADTALALINDFVAGGRPFTPNTTPEDALRLMGALARGLASSDGQRSAIVCVGSPAVCGLPEVISTASRELWPLWIEAIDAASDANAAVYSIVPGQMQAPGGTLHGATGGELFTTTSGLERVFSRIWSDVSQYYLLEYQPKSSGRDLTSIAVRVSRRGVTLRARARRGR